MRAGSKAMEWVMHFFRMAEPLVSKNETPQLTQHQIETDKRNLEAAIRELAASEQVLKTMLSEMQRTNEELRKTQNQLIQSEKLSSVGRLAAGVAHEVKNPLATLLLGAEYLSKNIRTNDETVKLTLESMIHAVRKADRVVKGLLDFASLRTLDFTTVDLHAVIDTALLLVKHDLDRYHIKVIKDFESDLPGIQMDHGRMEQVFVNLALNAIHAMEKGGMLTIRTRSKKLDQVGGKVGYRKTDVFRPGDFVAEIEMEDTGSGISEEHLDKIFDPFFTTRRGKGGTGLGLSVVSNFIHMHGGTIELQNRPAGGAKATVVLKIKSEGGEKHGEKENSGN